MCFDNVQKNVQKLWKPLFNMFFFLVSTRDLILLVRVPFSLVRPFTKLVSHLHPRSLVRTQCFGNNDTQQQQQHWRFVEVMARGVVRGVMKCLTQVRAERKKLQQVFYFIVVVISNLCLIPSLSSSLLVVIHFSLKPENPWIIIIAHELGTNNITNLFIAASFWWCQASLSQTHTPTQTHNNFKQQLHSASFAYYSSWLLLPSCLFWLPNFVYKPNFVVHLPQL